MEVRRVRAEEWEALRSIRLRALADAPDAFATTFESASARPEQWWRDWAIRSAESAEQAMFLAWDGAPVGIGGVFADDGDWMVIAMWSAPEARERGVGRAIVEAAVAFASGHDVFLWVTDGNDAARRLYESCGFTDTGALEPLRPGSTLRVRELRRPTG
ncbi:MAG TPA: GNAT family N-acetyltransferase [Gaiellaceae bacterium]|nr:GNAT family N-acetyltransferase [Gaiellaceae bacterium]